MEYLHKQRAEMNLKKKLTHALLSGDLHEVEHTICKIVITLVIDTSAIVLSRVYSINLDTIFWYDFL